MLFRSTASVVVTQEEAASAGGGSEVKSINFTVPYNNSGLYTISLDSGESVQVRFVGNDLKNNERYIQEGMAQLFHTSKDNIKVNFYEKFKGTGHAYDIYFRGALANTDIADITITESLTGEIIPTNIRQGSSATGETQRVSLQSSGEGDFTLTLDYGGRSYKTASLDFGASADKVRSALNAEIGRAHV